jgi:hypothetical protein
VLFVAGNVLEMSGAKSNLGTYSKLGTFQLASDLRDQSDLPVYACDELKRNLKWLKIYLKSPDVLKHEQKRRANAWFKPEAVEPLKRICAIKAVLEEFGYHIDMIKSDDVRNTIYEDGWQAVAKPGRR